MQRIMHLFEDFFFDRDKKLQFRTMSPMVIFSYDAINDKWNPLKKMLVSEYARTMWEAADWNSNPIACTDIVYGLVGLIHKQNITIDENRLAAEKEA